MSGLDAKIGDGKIDGVLGGSPDAEMSTVACRGSWCREDTSLIPCAFGCAVDRKVSNILFLLIRMDVIF